MGDAIDAHADTLNADNGAGLLETIRAEAAAMQQRMLQLTAALDSAQATIDATDYAEALDTVARTRDSVAMMLGSLAVQAVQAELTHVVREQDESDSSYRKRRITAERHALSEVAILSRQSPHKARRFVTAQAIMSSAMPTIRRSVCRGDVEFEAAEAIALEATHAPDRATQMELDRILAGQIPFHRSAGTRYWKREAQRRLAELDPTIEKRRTTAARRGRTVTLHDCEDGMAVMRAYLPRLEAHRAYTALRAAADTIRFGPEGRPAPRFGEYGRLLPEEPTALSDSQARADALIRLLTGDAQPEAGSVTLNIVMTERQLLEPLRGGPVTIHGYGTAPLEDVTDMIRDNHQHMWIRRLFTHPTTGQLIQMDSQRRRFTGAMAEFVTLRSGGICQAPYCNGTPRHIDHVRPVAAGGDTSIDNAAALDATSNLAKGARLGAATPTADGAGITWRTTSGHETTIHHHDFRTAAEKEAADRAAAARTAARRAAEKHRTRDPDAAVQLLMGALNLPMPDFPPA
ncbi:HNH endonuclease signature motif containing protein [Helcobacillus massiliensis]|uniref:HNH nuclease domain-containing protein n=1 Tax=Helcobacillus massiliensis TaxID=521392 RepID=A0A839QRR1_9MICO|nr:HNH endonuclease signature motif containing protein [Helcobacillus massiliensis]MBB3022358.1 hypothetical protein [Helcobacillus massiliensis]